MDEVTTRMIEFVKAIGIPVRIGGIVGDTVLPGITIEHGGLAIDPDHLLYPGDILHEAGHLAVAPPEIRRAMHGALDPKKDLEVAGELMAIPWSYAACLHLGIDPAIVFHGDGYHGGGNSIVENFAQGKYFGVPMLQWAGMTFDEKNAAANNAPSFPKMIKWIRE
ncbi:MAG: hypothetical protein Q8916_03870 [Bacteroidota bacterium]|nr:hypothetical protein [Bacteroidota bacterium]MDP4229525.1 hypothetical protein [Bacteroidota bacterium]MDP4236410.1 hypothetical protein [Bacteroidota bacterium]